MTSIAKTIVATGASSGLVSSLDDNLAFCNLMTNEGV